MINFFKKKQKTEPLKEANILTIGIKPIVMDSVNVKEPIGILNPLIENERIDTFVKNDVSYY